MKTLLASIALLIVAAISIPAYGEDFAYAQVHTSSETNTQAPLTFEIENLPVDGFVRFHVSGVDGDFVSISFKTMDNKWPSLGGFTVDADGTGTKEFRIADNLWRHTGEATLRACDDSRCVQTVYYVNPTPEPEPEIKLSVTTDKKEYTNGDKVTTSGIVSPVVDNSVRIEFLKDGEIIRDTRLSLDQSGHFTNTGNRLEISDNEYGTYTLKVSYLDATAQTPFELVKATPEPTPEPVQVFICHNDRTGYVLEEHVNMHLAHGDTLGKCTIPEPDNGKDPWYVEYLEAVHQLSVAGHLLLVPRPE